MTLDDIEKGVLGFGAAAIATLVGVVRGGDLRRIESIEKRQDEQHAAAEVHREKVFAEVHQLRRDTQSQHEEVVRLILETRR